MRGDRETRTIKLEMQHDFSVFLFWGNISPVHTQNVDSNSKKKTASLELTSLRLKTKM